MISKPAIKNNAVAMACIPPSCASITNGTMKKAKRRLFMVIPFSKWSICRAAQCVVGAPSIPEPLPNDMAVEIEVSAPFGQGLGFPSEGYKAANAAIAHLLPFSRPSAVFGAVWAVIVNAVKAGPFGALAHILGKSFVAITPTVANLNASGAVILEAIALRVFASLNHAAPCVVQRCSGFSVRSSGLSFPHAVNAEAAAGFCASGHKRMTVNFSNHATLTATDVVKSIMSLAIRFFQNSPAVKFSSGDVYCHLQRVS